MPNAAQGTPLPTQIGDRYTVLERLGRGGMAVVYRVRDEGRKTEVALKQLLVVDDAERRRKISALFEREFYMLAQLSHPSIVQAYDFGLDPTGPFYTMELLEGGDLHAKSPLAVRSCCEIAVQVCSALSLIHSRHFIHRDLSPRNIHCTRDGRAKLIDFGAMMPMGPCRQIVATIGFTSPEAIHGLALDARSDVFSLGATLYFLLTGRTAFNARTFDDLREAWRDPPVPPSALGQDVPPELDALILSLLRVDPAHRPRSAFEVMQRLAAIGDVPIAEAESVSQAYLSTPTLVGRDTELQHFRNSAQQALQGRGGGLWVEGVAGSGRSRVLDAWMLEARTLGMTVARSVGSTVARPFASAYELAEQLTEVLPELSLASAKKDSIFEALFDSTEVGRPRLKPLARLSESRDDLTRTLTTFIEGVCRERALFMAIDDIERVDEATVGLLAALAYRATERGLLMAVTAGTDATLRAHTGIAVLASHCERIDLRALTSAETEALFSSVFGPIPNVAMVSNRIGAIAMGNPRASMALAQHLVDEDLVRYGDGSWHLPAELTMKALPPDAEHVLRSRVANLPPLARQLAELQALAIAGQFDRADYAEFAGADNAAKVDTALDALVQRGVLTIAGDGYILSHGGDRALLLAAMPAERAAEYHTALALHFAANGPPLAEVHHWLMADATDRALNRLTELIGRSDDTGDPTMRFEIDSKEVAATFEEALRVGLASNRSLRELHDFARILVTLSIVTDNALHARYAKFVYDRLELDSGLADHRKLDPALPAAERLKAALDSAVARYQASPPAERVYRVDEAIRFLARHVSISVAIGARTRNAELLYTNAQILEPFAPFTPLLSALWQNSVAAYEMNILGCIDRARERVLSVYEDLGSITGPDQHYAKLIRAAIAAALAFIDTGLGLASATHWIEVIEKDQLQSVNAMYMRRIWSIAEGDSERAELYRKRAEVLALQSSMRQMFMPPLRHELMVQVRTGDLAGAKQVADQITRMAEAEPNWLPQHHAAQGYYQRMRGDLVAARAAFERAMESCKAGRTEAATDWVTWALAAGGYVGTLVLDGQALTACTIGRSALAQCEALEMRSGAWDLVRELAVAEAKNGEYESATQRMEALIAAREGALSACRIIDYETRVRIAIEAKDQKAAAYYLALLAQLGHADSRHSVQPYHVKLSDDARRAGMEVELPQTTFQNTVLAPRDPERRQVAQMLVAQALTQGSDPSSRAKRGLALLCEAAGNAAGGQLYLAHESSLYLAASQGVEDDLALEEMVQRHWRELTDSDGATTKTGHMGEPGTLWVGADGVKYQSLVLRSTSALGRCPVGIALLPADERQQLASHVSEIASALSTQFIELGDAEAASIE